MPVYTQMYMWVGEWAGTLQQTISSRCWVCPGGGERREQRAPEEAEQATEAEMAENVPADATAVGVVVVELMPVGRDVLLAIFWVYRTRLDMTNQITLIFQFWNIILERFNSIDFIQFQINL